MCTYNNSSCTYPGIYSHPKKPEEINNNSGINPMFLDTTVMICKNCYQQLFEQTFIDDQTKQINPVDTLRGVDGYELTLVSIRQDRHYLNKSFVFTVNKKISVSWPGKDWTVRKASGLGKEEYSKAKLAPPKINNSPSMGHSYVILKLKQAKTIMASYSFGYFPEGVVNPDHDAHNTLENEERIAIDYNLTKMQWNKAMEMVIEWKLGHSPNDYRLMGGKNCTSFARAVAEAADIKFLGEKIFTLEGSTDTPNRLYKALEKTSNHYDPSSILQLNTGLPVNVANAQSLHLLNYSQSEEMDLPISNQN